MVRSVVAGIGSYAPPKIVKNDDLAHLMTTSDEWIRTRSGIQERRFADEGVYCSDLALDAVKAALEDASLRPSDIDFIIFATLSPDQFFPGAGCFLQAKLGIQSIGCLDVRNQCTGFIYALATADAFIRSGVYRRVLVVGSEVQSGALNFSDGGRDVAVLFGDGAGAVVLEAAEENGRGILYSELHADGRFAKALHLTMYDISLKPIVTPKMIADGALWPQMDGRLVFKHAVVRLGEVIVSTLKKCGIDSAEIKYVIPHQANLRINNMVAERLGIPQEKFLSNIQKHGNTTAASIPLLLDQTYRAGKLERGDLLLLAAFGSGFTWGTTLLRW